MPQQPWLDNYIHTRFLGDAAEQIRANLQPGTRGLFLFAASGPEANFLTAYLRFSFKTSGGLIMPEENSPAPGSGPLVLLESVERLETPANRLQWRNQLAKNSTLALSAVCLWVLSPEHLRIWKSAGLMAPDHWSELSTPGLAPEACQRWVRHLSASDPAGGAAWSPEAYRQLHRATRGLPTSVQLLLHESLALAQKSKTTQITPDLIQYAMEDIALQPAQAEVFAQTPGLAIQRVTDWRASLADLLAEGTLKTAAPDASVERLSAFLAWPQACSLALGETAIFDALENAREAVLQRSWDDALALLSNLARDLAPAPNPAAG